METQFVNKAQGAWRIFQNPHTEEAKQRYVDLHKSYSEPLVENLKEVLDSFDRRVELKKSLWFKEYKYKIVFKPNRDFLDHTGRDLHQMYKGEIIPGNRASEQTEPNSHRPTMCCYVAPLRDPEEATCKPLSNPISPYSLHLAPLPFTLEHWRWNRNGLDRVGD